MATYDSLTDAINAAFRSGKDPTFIYGSTTYTFSPAGLIAFLAAEGTGLAGLTATATELNYNDITTLGTGAASKAVVLNASGDYTFPASATIVMPSGGDFTFSSGSTLDVAGTFEIANVAMTSSAAELNFNDGSVAGTAVASKTLVLGADKNVDTIAIADGGLKLGAGAGTAVTSTAAELNILDGVTATATTLNAAAAGTRGVVVIPDATPYSILAANSGKTHIISEQTATITLNLPTIAADLEYTFIMGGIATEAQDWIFSAGANYRGGVSFLDLDAGAGADEVHAGVYPNGSSNDVFTVVTPAAGTRIHFASNGTNWFVNGVVVSATVPTMADA